MITISRDVWRLVLCSKELVDDNKKDPTGNWIPTGTKSEMYKYTFKNTEFLSQISFSSKNGEAMAHEGKDCRIILEIKQFGNRKPEAKFVGVETDLKKPTTR